jgi:hypothetical protein
MSMYHLFLRTMNYDGVVEGLGEYVDAFETLEAAWQAVKDRRAFGHYWIRPVLMQFDGGNLVQIGELSGSTRYDGTNYNRRAIAYGWKIGDTFTEMETIYEQQVIVPLPTHYSGILQWQASDPF